MNLISWIVLGLIAGGLAKLIMPGDDPGNMNDLTGVAITILIGIAGAIIGGFLGNLIFDYGISSFSLRSLALAIGGSLIFLWAYRKFRTEKE